MNRLILATAAFTIGMFLTTAAAPAQTITPIIDNTGRELPAHLSISESGQPEVTIVVGDTAAVYPITIDPLFDTEVKLTASDAAAGDAFGYSVSISGDTAIVGAVWFDNSAGSAYIFQRDEGGTDNWGQVKKLTASDAAVYDNFGGSVSISGDTAVVGAYGNDDAGDRSGSAYIFQRDEGGTNNWGQVAKLGAGDAAANDHFGISVSVSGGTAIVGAFGNDDAGDRSGSAYIFQRDQGGTNNWGEVQKLTASDAAAIDIFGESVSISGDTAIVGARHDDDAGDKSGSAYIFQRDEGGMDNWGEVQKLTASDAAAGDAFGHSVAVSGDTTIVGAFGNDDFGTDSGSAYIFQRDEGGMDNWGEVQKRTASDAAAIDVFGQSVSISGGTAIVGARLDDDAGDSSGSAYIFQRDEGGEDNWGELAKLTASDAATGDNFGLSVGISGDTTIVGAPWTGDAGVNSGSAYVFFSTAVCGNGVVEDAEACDDGNPDDGDGCSSTCLVEDGWDCTGEPSVCTPICGDENCLGDEDSCSCPDDCGAPQPSEVPGATCDDGLNNDCDAFADCDDSDCGCDITCSAGEDCNENGISDECDIAEGTSQDDDGNGVPDECERYMNIKPGSCPNPFNRNSHGVLPVGLVGEVDFDVTQVVLSSLQLSRADGVGGQVAPLDGPPGPQLEFEDVASPFEGEQCECAALEGDGTVDLLMKFRTDDLVDVLDLDELTGGAVVELVLTGMLNDGWSFVASDCIVIVPPGSTSPANAFFESSVADTFIEITPLDLNIDSDGFADFARSYYSGTVMTATAPPTSDGKAFARWIVDGVLQESGVRSIDVTVTEDTTLRAYYKFRRPVPIVPTAPEHTIPSSTSGSGPGRTF